MPIDTIHADATAHQTRWQRCRDAVGGQYYVHQAGETYLPKLRDQTAEDYAAYKGRAGWYGATGRTLDGLIGMVFRRAPLVELPAALEAIAEDLTLSGESADAVARDVLTEVETVGRCGLLVEYPQAPQDTGPVTLAQASALNRRAYVTLYKAEHIRNWREERVNNVVQPVLIMLDEVVEEFGDDPYAPDRIEQIRELRLEGGVYIQRLHRKGRNGWAQHGADIIPRRNGLALNAIPFVAVGPSELSLMVQKPPILDLADTNFGHYKNTADLEHGAHFAGLPTPVITGYQAEEGQKLYIGSAAAWVFPQPEARASYLEFTGQGLQALEARCKAKEAQMAALGARMLAPEKAGIESADALSNRHSGEHSVLANHADLVSDAIRRVLTICAEWEGITGDITYKLSTDYTPAGLTAQQLTALVAAWQAGGISWETFFWNLKEGEIVASEVTEDDERGRLEAAGPALGALDDGKRAAA